MSCMDLVPLLPQVRFLYLEACNFKTQVRRTHDALGRLAAALSVQANALILALATTIQGCLTQRRTVGTAQKMFFNHQGRLML